MPYKNREDYLAWKRRYYQSHKEKWAKYAKENRDKLREYSRKRRSEKREEIREYQRKWADAHREQIRECGRRYSRSEQGKLKKKQYYESHKQAFFERAKENRSLHPDERKARQMVSTYLMRGKIKKSPCEICGNPKADAHHDDYNKPLEIRWLCRKHHAEWHMMNEPIRATNTRVCARCGKSFTFSHRAQKYCSVKCRKEASK